MGAPPAASDSALRANVRAFWMRFLRTRLVRWVLRQWHRRKPWFFLAVPATLIVADILLELLFGGVAKWLKAISTAHPVLLGLLENVLVTALAAAAAYFWLLGYNGRRALKRYRKLATLPAGAAGKSRLVDWSSGLVPLVRPGICKALIDEIERSPDAALVVVEGRAGTGRTAL